MHDVDNHIQKRLGSAMRTLALIEQRGSHPAEPSGVQPLLKQCRQLVGELENGFNRLQEAQAELAVQRQQVDGAWRRASLLLEISPVPCLVVSGGGLIVEANAAAATMLNTSLRHLQGKPFELFLAGDRDEFRSWLCGVAVAPQSDRRSVQLRPREQRSKQIDVVARADAEGDVALVLLNRDHTGVEHGAATADVGYQTVRGSAV